MSARRLPHGSRTLALVALLGLLVLAGCGGGESESASNGGPDPATVAPSEAAVYGEVLVRPSGDVQAGVVAAARKVLRVDDPGVELRRLIDEALADSGVGSSTQTYAKDIEPWLGDRLGVFLLLPTGGASEPDVGLAVAARDEGALEDELARQRADGDLRPGGTYRGVSYDVDRDDGSPNAVVGDFLVIGSTMRAFRAAVDASKGSNLAGEQRFEDATDALDADALAFVYADPQEIAAQLQDADAIDPQAKRLFTAPRLAQADPATLSLTARSDELVLQISGDADAVAAGGDAAGDDVTVGELPGDAWLAAATPPLGPLIRGALAGAGVHEMAAVQVRQALGLELDRDLLDPLGGLGLFVRGVSPLDIGGGALLQLADADAATRLVTRAQAIAGAASGGATRSVELSGARGFEVQIPQSPQPIVVLAKGDRIAVGYAASSAQDLLDPQERFGDGSAAQAAIESLGKGYTPSFVLLAPPLVQLLRSLDQLEVADLSSALPYASAYRSLAIGTQHDDEHVTVRVVAALR